MGKFDKLNDQKGDGGAFLTQKGEKMYENFGCYFIFLTSLYLFLEIQLKMILWN
jgi:hypothetical protein